MPQSGRDRCGLYENSGVQVITHLSMTLAITLGGLSLSIIVSSFDYNSKIDAQRLEMEELRAELLENPSPKSLNEFENEEELNNVILYNLEQVANVFLLSSILVLGAVLFQLISAITLLSTLHKENRAVSVGQLWSAVTCGVILCLSTALILLLCLNIYPVPYFVQDQVFILLTSIDILFSFYSLWVVLSLI